MQIMMELDGDKGLEYDICIDGVQSKCQSLNIWDVFWMNQNAEYQRKVVSGRKDAGAIRSWLVLGVCSLSVRGCCMKHCLILLCCMGVRQ